MTNGVCSFCNDDKLKTDGKRKESLDRHHLLAESLANHGSSKNSRYDCLVPLSGGKDSSYILYYVVTKMNLKPLAVFFDSGFTHELAAKNVKNICTKLGVEWKVIKSSHNYRKKAVVETVRMSKSLGTFFGLCDNCENNLRTMAINESIAEGIPSIVWGSTDYEQSLTAYNPEGATFRESFGNVSILASLFRLSYRNLFLMLRSPYHPLKHFYYIVKDNFDMKTPGGLKKLYPLMKVSFKISPVQVVYFFDYIEYNPLHQIDVLKKELEWEAPAGKESRMDCRLHCLANYNNARRSKISSDGFVMATLVRKGLMSRSEALRREDLIRETLEHDCLETLRSLGIGEKEVNGLLPRLQD